MTKTSHPKKCDKPSYIKVFMSFLKLFLIITIIKGLKDPQGTGRIFKQTTLKNLHPRWKKRRFVYPHLKATAFLFSIVLADLFSARVLGSPSRYIQKQPLIWSIDLDLLVYEPNRLDHSLLNRSYSKIDTEYVGFRPHTTNQPLLQKTTKNQNPLEIDAEKVQKK